MREDPVFGRGASEYDRYYGDPRVAAGNTTASVMGHAYPAVGATLGPALTFAWLGALHLCGVE